jgi:hypothetical protein
MDDFKIVRFVNVKACKRIFSEDSTFVLGSPKHYRYIEGGKKDAGEGIIIIKNTTANSFQNSLMSCWTRLETDQLTESDWDIFKKDEPILAFVSTPEKVEKYLKCQLDIKSGNLFFNIEKDKVTYYTQNTELPDDFRRRICFYKKDCFSNEREYRFVLLYSTVHHIIDYYTFITYTPESYYDKIFFNPNASIEDTGELCKILNQGDFKRWISNFEVLEEKYLEAKRLRLC